MVCVEEDEGLLAYVEGCHVAVLRGEGFDLELEVRLGREERAGQREYGGVIPLELGFAEELVVTPYWRALRTRGEAGAVAGLEVFLAYRLEDLADDEEGCEKTEGAGKEELGQKRVRVVGCFQGVSQEREHVGRYLVEKVQAFATEQIRSRCH